MDIQRQRLEKIQNLLNMNGNDSQLWKNFANVHGILIVPDEATATWVLHTIVNGLPTGSHQIRGDWAQRLVQGGFGKRLLKAIYKEISAKRGSTLPTKVDLARLNAVMWWIHHGRAKDSGVFMDVEQVEKLLTQKTMSESAGDGE